MVKENRQKIDGAKKDFHPSGQKPFVSLQLLSLITSKSPKYITPNKQHLESPDVVFHISTSHDF